MKNTLAAELLAEFLGTMVLILFGNGVVAMVVLFDKGEYTNITLAWGLAVTMGNYIAGKISGAHLQSAVTVALARVSRTSPGRKVLPYSLVQIAGASWRRRWFIANYGPQFQKSRPDPRTHRRRSSPRSGVPGQSPLAGLLDQTIGTALLLLMILAITDERNTPPGNMAPLMVGLVGW